MSRRRYEKDRLAEHAKVELITEHLTTAPPQLSDPFHFWVTNGTQTHLVDLSSLRDGQKSHNGKWAGPYTGRPELAEQLLPAIKDGCIGMAENSTHQVLTNLRTWWRLFDAIESAGGSRITCVSQLTEVHRQAAIDSGMRRKVFRQLIGPVNATRKALGHRALFWISPQDEPTVRKLAPDWQVREIRRAIRRKWYEALDRWAESSALISSVGELDARQTAFKALLIAYKEGMEREGKAFLKVEEFVENFSHDDFYASGCGIDKARAAFFPDVSDVRAAFNRCMSETGWNSSTLLGLDVDESFIETHPIDKSRYVMTGYKARANAEQPHVGLWKSQGAPANILLELIRRTTPLRNQLINNRDALVAQYESEESQASSEADRTSLFEEIQSIEMGIRSPWLYISKHGINWLNKVTYNKLGKRKSYIKEVILEINKAQPADRRIDLDFVPSDFRDAYAAYIWTASGGSVLHVMQALGHRSLRSSVTYTDNVLLTQKGEAIFLNFGNALWAECTEHGHVDPTLIAKRVRDGGVPIEARRRLQSYRELRKSRLGIFCANPFDPPKHIAPTFQSDGKRPCNVHRCTLCYENAIITKESFDGLSMRVEELEFIHRNISASGWLKSRYPEELENTRAALSGFPSSEVTIQTAYWRRRIENGEHVVPGFELNGEGGAD